MMRPLVRMIQYRGQITVSAVRQRAESREQRAESREHFEVLKLPLSVL